MRLYADNIFFYSVVLSLSQADSVLQTPLQQLQASKYDLMLYNTNMSVLTHRPWTMFTFTPWQGTQSVTAQAIDVVNHYILIVREYLSVEWAQFCRWSNCAAQNQPQKVCI